jgi:hypothetical protein
VNGWQPEDGGGGAVDSVNGQTGVVVLDADDIDDSTTTNKFTTQAEIDKLAGIEAGADVTDAANVTTALGSISVTAHSDVTSAGSGQIITTIERDKLDGIEAGAEVNTVDSVNTQTGAVVLDADDIDDTSTTNKFTTQSDIDKLAGIEAGAEVNTVDSVNSQTGVVVLDADDIDDTSTTNKFTNQTDIDKLAGIEALADVTDATNVAAAGALMDGVAELADLADVASTAPSDGQVLTYDTVNGWQPETPSGGGTIDGSGTADYIAKWSDSDTLTDSVIYEDSGNIGIGTSSPTTKLDIVATSATSSSALIKLDGGGNGFAGSNDAGTAYSIQFDGISYSLSSGSVKRTGAEIQMLKEKSWNEASTGAGTYGAIVFKTNSGTIASPNLSERMRITSGGSVYFHTTVAPNPGDKGVEIRPIAGTGQIVIGANNTGSSIMVAFNNPNGLVGQINASGSSTSYITSSDYRLKENVVPMEGALDRVDALKPSRFNFIADPSTTVDGFLAHQVAEVIPEAITGEKDATEEYEITPAVVDDDGNVIEEAVMGTRPVYQGIDQSKLVPLLVGAIQELRAEIELLKSK